MYIFFLKKIQKKIFKKFQDFQIFPKKEKNLNIKKKKNSLNYGHWSS